MLESDNNTSNMNSYTNDDYKIPHNIRFMLTRKMNLTTPADIYMWFRSLNPTNQKIMMMGFTDSLKMESNKYDLNTHDIDSAKLLPLHRQSAQGDPVDENSDEEIPKLKSLHLEPNIPPIVRRQSSTGFNNENNDDIPIRQPLYGKSLSEYSRDRLHPNITIRDKNITIGNNYKPFNDSPLMYGSKNTNTLGGCINENRPRDKSFDEIVNIDDSDSDDETVLMYQFKKRMQSMNTDMDIDK